MACFDVSPSKVQADSGAPRAGWYLFGRAGGLNRKTPPGTARKGQFCAISHVKARYTSAQIMRGLRVTTVCNGEGMARKKRSRM